jgi:hypothetical protein
MNVCVSVCESVPGCVRTLRAAAYLGRLGWGGRHVAGADALHAGVQGHGSHRSRHATRPARSHGDVGRRGCGRCRRRRSLGRDGRGHCGHTGTGTDQDVGGRGCLCGRWLCRAGDQRRWGGARSSWARAASHRLARAHRHAGCRRRGRRLGRTQADLARRRWRWGCSDSGRRRRC